MEDVEGLGPASILRARRDKALKNRGIYLFREGENDLPVGTQVVIKSLKSLMKKLNINKRVTVHSAHKGSAMEMILRGDPLVIVKVWGIWVSLDTLETYIGRVIREEVPHRFHASSG